ncbi:MAG: hypothetical protein D6741_05745 [Planctomycetota bacterium]|nr:MAG: hypothetical protein D6741_05745 [Planctomycetota bacterium]
MDSKGRFVCRKNERKLSRFPFCVSFAWMRRLKRTMDRRFVRTGVACFDRPIVDCMRFQGGVR